MAEGRKRSERTTEAVERILDAAAHENQHLEALPGANKVRIAAGAEAEEEAYLLKIEQRKAEVQNYKQDMALRQEYSKKLFRLLLGWTAGLWIFLLLQGFKLWGFEVDTNVALGVVINVTVAVVGLFLVVTKNLFPSRDSAAPKKTGSSH